MSTQTAPTTLTTRLRTTAAVFAGLVLTGAIAVATISISGASPAPPAEPPADHHDHAAMGSPLADGDPPALPAPGEVVGVLDIFGRPLLGPDGQPLSVPLRPPNPRLPANAREVLPPGGAPPTAGSTEVDLLTAHAVTLNEVANDERYSLVRRFDLFRVNGLLTSAAGQTDGLGAYRALLVALDQQMASDNSPAACATATTAAVAGDGAPTDLVAGAARPQMHAEVVAARTLACP